MRMQHTYTLKRGGDIAGIANILQGSGHDSPRTVILSHIWIRPGTAYRGHGLGTRLLEIVLRDAERTKTTLLLSIGDGNTDEDSLSEDLLAAWFVRHGFVLMPESEGSAYIRRPGMIRRRCKKAVTNCSRDEYDIVFEQMHWACFHLAFEHVEQVEGEACSDPSCPIKRRRRRANPDTG